MERYIQVNNQIISRKLTQVTSLYFHLHHTRTRLLSHWIASVRYQLPTVSPFKSLPPYLSPTVLNTRSQIKPKNVRLWTVRNWRQQT